MYYEDWIASSWWTFLLFFYFVEQIKGYVKYCILIIYIRRDNLAEMRDLYIVGGWIYYGSHCRRGKIKNTFSELWAWIIKDIRCTWRRKPFHTPTKHTFLSCVWNANNRTSPSSSFLIAFYLSILYWGAFHVNSREVAFMWLIWHPHPPTKRRWWCSARRAFRTQTII